MKQSRIFAAAFLWCLLASILLWQGSQTAHAETHTVFWVRSASFSNGKSIPGRYTCDGADLSPQLQWQTAPAGTKSFALVMDDPDATTDFTHWLVYNIPPDVLALAEGGSRQGVMPQGSAEGRNDFGRRGYGGPCPPRGNPHHYFFKVYALDIRLNLPVGATRKQVDAAMSGHVLAKGQIVGTCQRVGQ
ncbi:MAG: YbhB/YbcL family Raf kinase inhibitor-like protein [Terracidiphilus sp.]